MTQELQTTQIHETRTRSNIYEEITRIVEKIDLGADIATHTLLNIRLRDLVAAYKAAPIGG